MFRPHALLTVIAAIAAVMLAVTPAAASGTTYSDDQLRDLVGGARYLDMTVTEYHEAAAASLWFVINISGAQPLDLSGQVPAGDAATIEYDAERIGDLAAFYNVTEAEAGKIAVTFFTFIVGIDAIANTGSSYKLPSQENAVSVIGDGSAIDVERGIVYGQGEVAGGGQHDLLLDLYTPRGATGPLPLVVVIHGGGFKGGTRTGSKWMDYGQAFARQGYAVASIDYRLLKHEPVPAPRMAPMVDFVGSLISDPQVNAALAAFDDTITALDHLTARPDIDGDRIALVGGSAGAITAMYVAYTLDDFGIASQQVDAVIDNSGGLMLHLGDPSPIEAGEAALFIAHGTDDQTVPYQLTQDVIDHAPSIGLDLTVHTNVGGGHGVNLHGPFNGGTATVFDTQVEWLMDRVPVG